MILLRYGIRCSLHYSVPLTLGLIAYTGSWQGVARNLMSETKVGGKPNPADAKATEVAAGKDGTGNSTTGSGLQDRPEGESLAMKPESGDAPRSLTIPRADSRRSHDPVADSASIGSSRSRSEPDRPPRDRDIDATGHQAPVVQSEPNQSGPPPSAAMAAGAAGLAYVAVNPQNIGSQQVTAPVAKPEKAIEKSPEPAASPTELASEATGSGSDPGTKTDGSNPPQTADAANRKLPAATQPDAAIAVASSGEPAHLNPQIRAIAAEVPIAASIAESVHPESSKPSDRPEDIQTASRANESAKPSQEVRQDPPAPVASAAPPAEVAALKAGPKENVPVDSPKVVAKFRLASFVQIVSLRLHFHERAFERHQSHEIALPQADAFESDRLLRAIGTCGPKRFDDLSTFAGDQNRRYGGCRSCHILSPENVRSGQRRSPSKVSIERA